MQFMLMCCFDENIWERLPNTEKERIMREYRTVIQSLIKNGQLRSGGQLQPTATATTVRMKQGKTILTDGPFAETKEQLGGVPRGRMQGSRRGDRHCILHPDPSRRRCN